VIQPGGSDSATLDNVIELLYLSGRSMAHAMAMLIPEAWDADQTMPPEKRAFYEYHASLMEPWTAPPPSPSPTAALSAPRSIATACARPATSSPPTTC